MITVEFAGEDTREVDPQPDATYGDLLAPFEASVHEVTITVDGRPVPEDASIPAGVDRVRVVRLIAGG
jgi:sulfur carrier protein